MNSKDLQEKVNASEQKVIKIQETLSRHIKMAQKKLDQASKCLDPDEQKWLHTEYSMKLFDIETSQQKLQMAQTTLINWQKKLIAQIEKERIIETQMPEIFRTCQMDLANEWTKYDLEAKAQMMTKRSELPYKEFRKLYKYSQEQDLLKTKDEFHRANLKSAEEFIIDLYNRVKAITGEVKDWSGIHYGGKALNGLVEGENGMARVETIIAGGYNIQIAHYRVLVKRIG